MSIPVAQLHHNPVMLPEVLQQLAPCDGGVYVDGTFGAGGYSRAIVTTANCRLYGIDRDPITHRKATTLSEIQTGQITLLHGSFGDMDALLSAHLEHNTASIDGIVLDIGVSSLQLDDPTRGFSFRADGPLDMRMDTVGTQITAADLVNTADEAELADIFYRYGEEKKSRQIARAIAARRTHQAFTRTGDLADVIRAIVRKGDNKKTDPATRSFQALRIAVNDELGELTRGLAAAEKLLKPLGRLVVVSFHSLEDRIVKNFLREKSGDRPRESRHHLEPDHIAPPSFRQLFRKALSASAEECKRNPRARSARMRAAERTAAPAQHGGSA